jgi:hypothetical protein
VQQQTAISNLDPQIELEWIPQNMNSQIDLEWFGIHKLIVVLIVDHFIDSYCTIETWTIQID